MSSEGWGRPGFSSPFCHNLAKLERPFCLQRTDWKSLRLKARRLVRRLLQSSRLCDESLIEDKFSYRDRRKEMD